MTTDYSTPAGKLLCEIEEAKKYFESWEKDSSKIVSRYRNEKAVSSSQGSAKKFALLWSNVQTLQPALYSKPPKINVSRRYHDQDELSRIASMVLERATTFEMELDNFHEHVKQARDDYLLPGRGTLWQRYEPTIVQDQTDEPMGDDDEQQETEDTPVDAEKLSNVTDQAQVNEEVAEEHAPTDYVHWKDFIHDPASVWDDTKWGARRVLMTKPEATKRFKEKAENLKFTTRRSTDDKNDPKIKQQKDNSLDRFAVVWEVWDKRDMKAKWISPDWTLDFLDELPDPLHLQGFFPFPKPLYATMTTDRCIPVPDYHQYVDQAEQIDRLTQRIALLVKAVAIRGAYDKSNAELANLLNERPENFLVPVDNWAAFAEKGGLKGQISFVPLSDIVSALNTLVQQRQMLIQDCYQITGISDIVRGQTAASETATAQRIKGNFATLRLDDRRTAISEFVRDALRKKAEVICEHFDPQTMRDISGYDQMTEIKDRASRGEDINALFDKVWDVLSNDTLRLIRLDIETDSMVEADQQQEKQDRNEFLTAAGGFLEKAVTASSQYPMLAPLLFQMLMFGVRGFKAGRELEEVFESTFTQLQQMAKNPPPQQQNPEAIKAQQDAQAAQAQQQLDANKQAFEQDMAKQQLQLDAQDRQRKADYDLAESQRQARKDEMDHALAMKEFEANLELQRMELMLKYPRDPDNPALPLQVPKEATTNG